MPFAPKIVLHCPDGIPPDLEPLLHQFVLDGVKYVGVVGPSCERIEDTMDEVAISHGSPSENFVLTASHKDETLEDAISLAKVIGIGPGSEVQVVEVRGASIG